MKWWLPIGVASLLGAVVAAVVIGIGPRKARNGAAGEGPAAVAVHFRAGREALGQGKFRIAAAELAAAEKLQARFADSLAAGDRRQLRQLHREAELLRDLPVEPLDDILRHAADRFELDEREWEEEFAVRYRDKAIVFDDEVRHEGGGVYRLATYPLQVRGRPAQLALGDLQLLRALPLDRPQRLLLGARLASVRPEPGGTWVVHLVPDSGVLLTDLGGVHACYPLPPEELRDLLQRQAAWVAEMRQ